MVGKHNEREALGTREIISEDKEVQSDGKVHIKYNLGQYRWMTYREIGDMSEKFGRGLRETAQPVNVIRI